MVTTIEIDDALVKAAQKATGETDERKAVETVLRQVTSPETGSPLAGLTALAGADLLRDDYDHKALRIGDQR